MWGHNKERGRRGENLFAITDEGLDVPLAMEEWHHEREHYNLSAATCATGQMCGHYTQVRSWTGGRGHRAMGGAGKGRAGPPLQSEPGSP